jgi:hypothetical protein
MNQEYLMKTISQLTRSITQITASVFLVILFCSFAVPESVQAKSSLPAMPELKSFVERVKNGDANILRGVYVQDVMAYPIIQQPGGDSKYVSTHAAVVTQFDMAARMGNVGLLAHNNLAGASFFKLVEGSQIALVYGDGRTETFVVEKILKYEVVARGVYKDIKTQQTLDTGEVFDIAYGGEYHLTLQTCIENEGNFSWGRMFVIAKPVVARAITPDHY